MVIPKGYKQTEVGVVPEDWQVCSIKEITNGGLNYGVNAPAVPYMPPLPNYIRITDISNDGKFIKEGRTSVDCANAEKYTLHDGDIVFARTGASVGKSYLYEKEDGLLVYAGFLIKASVNKEKASARYIFESLHLQRYWDWVALTSMRSGQPGINGKEYGSYLLPFPEYAEQTKIAMALLETDALVSSLEKLIAKKKAIKQGAMQELVTGKRRLSGYNGGWKITKLSEILTICHGQSQRKVEDNAGKYPILATGGVIGYTDSWLCNEPSVLIGRKGTIDKPQYMETPFWTIDTLFYTKIKDGNCAKFIYYLFLLINWLDYNEASGVPSLSAKAIGNIEVILPDKEEQVAITEILSDMDNEIQILEQKLEKYRQTKQGMMQQLLTGKIRLT